MGRDHMGSTSQPAAEPDHKMGSRHKRPRRTGNTLSDDAVRIREAGFDSDRYPTSAQRQVAKGVSNARRRRRDRSPE